MNSKELGDDFPEPEEVDFAQFCGQEEDGTPTYLPALLATYLAVLLDPIRYVGDGFMLYRDGEWDYLSSVGVLRNICFRALKNDATVERTDDAIWELEDLVYEEPPPGWEEKPYQGIVIKETCPVCQRRTGLRQGSRTM